MKEKIKKMFQYICTWKFVVWLNVVCAVFYIPLMFIELHSIHLAAVAWHFGLASMACFLQDYENRHREDMFCVVSLNYHFADCLAQLNRYKTRYGELPPDAPSVQPQQPSEESEQPQADTRQADTPEEPDVAEEPETQPSAVSKKPRNVNRKPRTAPKKPRTKKSKEEQ